MSTALTELEKQLGIQLFERDNKRVLVTPQGREVLRRAQVIWQEVKELEGLAAAQKAPLSTPMSVGFIPTIGPYLLPKILPLLQEQHPDFELTVVEEQSQQLLERVRSGEIDTAVLALPYPLDGLLAFEFGAEDFYWVAHKSLVKRNQREIASHELDQAKLMLLKEGHCLKEHILEACKLGAQTANHGFGATSLNTLIQMVVGKLGTTLVPAMALESLIEHNDQLSAVHLNEPSPHRRLAFVVRPNYSRLASIEALSGLCKQALGKGSGATP